MCVVRKQIGRFSEITIQADEHLRPISSETDFIYLVANQSLHAFI